VSLFDAAERFAAMDRSQIILDAKRCLHSQDQNSTCSECLRLCPENAIIEGKPPSLNVEACRSCLACIPSCPVGAYQADDAVVSLLNCAARVESGPVELICARHPHPETGMSAEGLGIRVPGCLAGLGAGALVLLSSLGIEKVILRMDACKECPWGGLQTHVEKQVSQARLFLAAWGKSSQIACSTEREGLVDRPVWDSKNPPLSRRDMFRLFAQQGKLTMARAIENERTNPGHRPGRDRLRMLGAITHLPTPERTESLQLGEMNFAFLSASEACTACAVCARVCPTSALQFEKNKAEKAYTLTFSARNCVGCEMCMHVCAPSALTLDRTPTFAQIFSEEIVTLQEGGLVKCTRCGVLTAAQPGVNLCPLCEYRRTHPFGSMLPPGVQLQLQAKKKKRS